MADKETKQFYLINNLTGFVYPETFDNIDRAIEIQKIENTIKSKKFFPDGYGYFQIWGYLPIFAKSEV